MSVILLLEVILIDYLSYDQEILLFLLFYVVFSFFSFLNN